MVWFILALLLFVAVRVSVASASVLRLDSQNANQNQNPAVLLPSGLIHGTRDRDHETESFKGIPFAKPPVGELRLRPPEPYTGTLSNLPAYDWGTSCIPMDSISSSWLPKEVPASTIDRIFNSELFRPRSGRERESEDCLSVNVFRPANVAAPNKLPVMVYIYGGGFEGGTSTSYDPTNILLESIRMYRPVIMATFNYRSGAFGFLAGADVKQAQVGNLGLLDQRLALKWISDNIEYFGGDPDNITLFGESAGAISIAHHMIMYDGNNTLPNGRKLFHGAIMQSGALPPADAIDGSYAQSIYDQFIVASNCSQPPDAFGRLQCLRNLTTEKFVDAQRRLPGLFSYNSLALSFMPRYDGLSISALPLNLLRQGKYTRVPYISGNQQDEGTVFSLTQANVTSDTHFRDYIAFLLPKVRRYDIKRIATLYPDIPKQGSPFNGMYEDNLYGQFKRLAAFQGDITFQWPRRFFLEHANDIEQRYSFQSRALSSLPVLGTFHSSDSTAQFHAGLTDMPAINAYRRYWVAFAYSKNPNIHSNMTTFWTPYDNNDRKSLVINDRSLELGTDTYRWAQYAFISGSWPTLLL